MERLLDSCKILMIDVPYTLDELVDATKETVRVNDVPDGCYIRPLVYLGYGEMGVNPHASPVNVAIAVWPWGAYLGDRRRRQRRADEDLVVGASPPNSMPTASKTVGGYVNSGLAKVEAIKAGYDEAIMLGTDGRVSECTGENLFIVRDGLIIESAAFGSGRAAGHHAVEHRRIANDLGYDVQFRSDAPRRPLPRRRGVPHRHGRRGRADRLSR